MGGGLQERLRRILSGSTENTTQTFQDTGQSVGFIVELRRQKEAEKARAILGEINRQRIAEERALVEEEEKRRRVELEVRNKARAIEIFKQTDLPRQMQELSVILNGLINDGDILVLSRGLFVSTSGHATDHLILAWDIVKGRFIKDDYDYSCKSIEARAFPDGNILVKGGLSGTTVLPESLWRGNPIVQEKALEKAYRHPNLGRYKKRDVNDGNFSGQGQGG